MDHLSMQADPALLRLLAQSHDDHLEGYLLVDLSISALTQPLILELYDQQRSRSLFQATPEEGFVHIAPHLIAWHELSAQERNRMIDLDQKIPAITWLWVPQEASPILYRHLKSQLNIRLPDGDLALLRYYDPRVWLKLMAILDDEQKAQLIGPVKYWSVNVSHQRHVFEQQETYHD